MLVFHSLFNVSPRGNVFQLAIKGIQYESH